MAIRIGPQPGPQTKFAACTADWCFYGGQAGGGKTYAALLEALKWVRWRGFEAAIFRRNEKDLRGAGSLWNEACSLYRAFGAELREGAYKDARWLEFNSMVQFAHLHQESDVHDWQGRQLALAIFEEATHFTAFQWWYIWTRCRSKCGVKPYMRATCNPDPDSWVAKLIEWWIDQDTGYAIPERDGVIRWLCRVGDEFRWFDTKEECQSFLHFIEDKKQKPLSVTFINAKLEDNAALMSADPDYEARLAGQDSVQRARLGDGNWKVREGGGAMFDRSWFDIIDKLPDASQWAHAARGWDKAATRPNPDNKDPDWTRGVKGIYLKNGTVVIADMVGLRDDPGAVDALIRSTAKLDGPICTQAFWLDGAQAGKVDQAHTVALLRKEMPNCRNTWEPASKSKIEFAKPFAAFCSPAANNGLRRAKLLRAPWNAEFLAELDRFPKPKGVKGEGVHDDIVDALSRMWLEIGKGRVGNADRFKVLAGLRP